MILSDFQFFTTKNIWFGPGCISRIGQVLGELGISRALVVADPGLVSAGIAGQVEKAIKDAGIETGLFGEVEPNPSLENAETCYERVVAGKFEATVGVGGGSAMDVAKVAAMLVNNPPPVLQYVGFEKIPQAGIPMIAVPTTAGTGSEVTNTAILKNTALHIKAGLISRFMVPTAAVVDPQLTLSLPARGTAATGMDALVHSIEGYTVLKANPHSDIYHREAIRLIANNLRTAVGNGKDLTARYNMCLGAMFAGIGLANSSCGAVHALAYPMEGRYVVMHGEANAALLPFVMEYNMLSDLPKFAEIAVLMGENINGLNLRDAAYKGIEAVKILSDDVGIPTLKEIGVKESDLPDFVEAALDRKALVDNNPRKLSASDTMDIYMAAM